MLQKPWLDTYPEGVPAEIDPSRYASLAELVHESFGRHRDAAAFSNRGSSLSFGEVDRLSRDFAAFLRNDLGLSPGERVAVMLPNLLQSPVVIFGIVRAGLVTVNVNPMYTPHELEHQLRDSQARVIVVLENFAHTVEAVLPGCRVGTVVVTRVGDQFPRLKRLAANWLVKHVKRLVPRFRIDGFIPYRDALARGRDLDYRDPPIAASDLAFLQYTGGTTGLAKGAMLTHGNLVSNVLQAVAWVRPFYRVQDGDVVTALPLYHIFALTVNLLAFVEIGAHNVLITDPRDLGTFVKELKRIRLAFITGVNTLFNALLHSREFADVDCSSLRISLGGGMAVQADVAERWQRATGNVICQGYGLTEASPIVSANPLDAKKFNGSVGLPLPSTDVRILDETGRELDLGEIGEICVRGPQVMAGYWNQPEETALVLSGDGWLRTGDIGRVDAQGYLFIEDRKKDVIIVSGFNVYPNEVENVVTAHPDVIEAAAIGIPSEESGEAVKIFVVRKNNEVTAQELLAHCRRELTGYKVPDAVEFVDELPKSNVGKVLRRELKTKAPAEAAS
jgi:long-chain acyl-CoA synthetase